MSCAYCQDPTHASGLCDPCRGDNPPSVPPSPVEVWVEPGYRLPCADRAPCHPTACFCLALYGRPATNAETAKDAA